MTLNPFFLQGSAREQFLIQDLINEQLKIYGIDVYYLPRKFLKTDDILREVQSSKFDDSFIIEAYLDNYEGYAPGSDLMTKFGLRLKNEINLVISQERFQEFISPFLYAIQEGVEDGLITDYDINLPSRPREGDLIYFPLGERLFEIKRVEAEKPFYQLGKTYVYELLCELYEYENEDIDTSIEEIDNTVKDEGYITTLRLENLAISATATATLGVDGMIGRIVLNEDGYNYSTTPTVSISASPTGNPIDNATAVAITTSIGNVQSVKEIRITNAGFGYSSLNPPEVTISGGSGVGAAATAIVVNDGVRLLSISTAGLGYYTTPTVIIDPPIGNGASGIASVSSAGIITSVSLTSGGEYYSQITPPSVTFSDPPISPIVKFGNNSLEHTAITDVSDIGFIQNFIDTSTTGISIRFWIYPSEFGTTSRSILHTENNKVSVTVAGEIIYNSTTSPTITGGQLVEDQWNYVQIDTYQEDIRISINGVLGTLFNGVMSTTQIFEEGEILKVGAATAAESVADSSLDSFVGYIDDISITEISSIPVSVGIATVSFVDAIPTLGDVFKNTLDSSTATGITTVSSEGIVTQIVLTNVGSGYYRTNPTVSIANTSGNKDYNKFYIKGATAEAVISNGSISSLQIVNAGYGYTTAPNVTISGVSTTGFGTYIKSETITGSLSGTTAEIKDISIRRDINADNPPIDLFVGSNDGQFSAGEVITGSESSAAYILKSYDNNSYEESYDINEEIETEADGILDFTESNPFGEY